MGFFDGLTDMLTGAAGGLQEQIGNLTEQGTEGLSSAADSVQEAIPGNLEDGLVDGLQNSLDDLTNGQQ